MRIWLLLSLVLIGCANEKNKCGSRFLTLWPNASGAYSLQVVDIPSLKNPYSLSGPVVNVYYEAGQNRAGFEGDAASPQFTESDGICVPLNAESTVAVSVYAQFEKIFEFEGRIGTRDLLSWPRNAGVDIHLAPSASRNGLNNAHYYSDGDAISVLPYSLGHVPLAANHGLIAHEHFHAHFQKQVLNVVNEYVGVLPDSRMVKPTEDFDNDDIRSARGINNFILRAWNEGLADFYGSIYSGDPNFIASSLPQLFKSRALTEPMSRLATGRDFAFESVQGSDHLTAKSYFEGSQLARLLYRLSFIVEESPEAFLGRVVRNLREVPAYVVPRYDREYLNMEDIVPFLLREVPRTPEVCRVLVSSLSKDMLVREFGACLE